MPTTRPAHNNEEKPEEKTADGSERGSFQIEKELFEARVILISSPVNAKLAHHVNMKLLALERASQTDPVYLFINSPGGEIHSGFSIYDMCRFIKPQVVTVVTGLAASMGSIIALAAPKKYRYAFPNSKFLIHQPSIGGLGGSVSDIEIHAKDLIDTKNRIIELYCAETGRKADEIREALDRDRWMSPTQALEYGLIGKIVNSREDIKF